VRPVDIGSGSVDKRLAAVVRLLKPRAAQPDPNVLSAVRRESLRLLAEYREGTSDANPNLNVAYGMALIQLLGATADPAVIPILVDYSGLVSFARDALVKFGEPAVRPMIVAARGRDEFGQISGVVMALAEMLRETASSRTPLSHTSRQEIAALAEELLGARFRPVHLRATAKLALATGRSDLREQLEQLATDRHAWTRRGTDDPYVIEFGQGVLQGLLKQPGTAPMRP
jgi:hypothetical protein